MPVEHFGRRVQIAVVEHAQGVVPPQMIGEQRPVAPRLTGVPQQPHGVGVTRLALVDVSEGVTCPDITWFGIESGAPRELGVGVPTELLVGESQLPGNDCETVFARPPSLDRSFGRPQPPLRVAAVKVEIMRKPDGQQVTRMINRESIQPLGCLAPLTSHEQQECVAVAYFPRSHGSLDGPLDVGGHQRVVGRPSAEHTAGRGKHRPENEALVVSIDIGERTDRIANELDQLIEALVPHGHGAGLVGRHQLPETVSQLNRRRMDHRLRFDHDRILSNDPPVDTVSVG